MLKKFIIKVNNHYYAGEHEDTVPTPRPTQGWYCNRGESSVIHFLEDKDEAVVIEGLINLNSHWGRIYNAMKYDGLDVQSIQIEKVN